MPKPTSDIITTQQHRRIFMQLGGPSPNNAVKYAGQDAQYMVLEGVKRPILGGLDNIRVPDPSRLKGFKTVGRKAGAPDLPTATLRLLENHGALPWQLGDIDCPFNLYMPVGQCKDLSDFLNGWSDWVEIYSYAEATEVDMGDRTAWEDDNQNEDALSLTLEAIYAIGGIAFSEKAATLVDREVVDVVYGSDVECGSCGPVDDGTQKIYFVTKSSGAGSPGLQAEVIYSLDGGLNWSQVNIAGIGATEDPLAIEIVGDKLVVLGVGAYYWATINSDTGVPGAFTKVTTGFVGGKDPNDIFVLSPRETFFCGDGGYIYRSTDITAGVLVLDAAAAIAVDLFRIHGDGAECIVAVGAGDGIIRSLDRGTTWGAPIDSSPSGAALDIVALAVKSRYEWWLGTAASGRLYFTLDAGATWTMKTFTGTGTGNLRDIVFATEEVIYFLHDDATPTAHLWTSWDGGQTFGRDDGAAKRILNWPVFDHGNRIAVPQTKPATAANHLVVAGLAGNGTDGILIVGEAGSK